MTTTTIKTSAHAHPSIGTTSVIPAEAILPEFTRVHAQERHRLALNPLLNEPDGVGLALSGGGIRSASFSLGVVQSLLNNAAFSRIDYLSTVSGGGYLGSAISWWIHVAATGGPYQSNDETPSAYEAFRQQFGSKVTGSRTRAAGGNWLAYIRQHGNYLQPRNVGTASLAASVLRVCLYPLVIYAAALLGIFCEIHALEDYTESELLQSVGLLIAIVPTIVLVGMSWIYGPATWAASQFRQSLFPWLYRQRTAFRLYSGYLLSAMLIGLLIASIPAVYGLLPTPQKLWVSTISSLSLGSIGTAYQFFKGRAQSKTPSWLANLRLVATAALVIYGLLLGTYAAAAKLPDSVDTGLIALGFSAVFGLFVDTNLAGLARLYRDRLMEAFLPDSPGVATNSWALAQRANIQNIAELKGRVERPLPVPRVPTPPNSTPPTLAPPVAATSPTAMQSPAAPPDAVAGTLSTDCQRPLHLVNCNLVLMDSKSDLYHNRGGDSFVISQQFSGSNATGWIHTERLGDGDMTLATAMSISGAAANPNAAPNGLGITRNRLVSFLMSLFNVRLGFWIANPKHPRTRLSNKPNFWFPGFRQGLLGSGLSEKATFVELTDGGHFDNTAIYELVRRRTKLIIVAQAGCDPKCTMEDLANAIEKVRVDFSVFIEFDDINCSLDSLRPASDKLYEASTRGYAIGRIRYPKGLPTDPQFDDGIIVYLQAVTATLPADIASYWRRHAEFPNDTTADQFFTEENLEAYRELGYALTSQFYKDLKAHAEQRNAHPAGGDSSPSLTQIANILPT